MALSMAGAELGGRRRALARAGRRHELLLLLHKVARRQRAVAGAVALQRALCRAAHFFALVLGEMAGASRRRALVDSEAAASRRFPDNLTWVLLEKLTGARSLSLAEHKPKKEAIPRSPHARRTLAARQALKGLWVGPLYSYVYGLAIAMRAVATLREGALSDS